MASSASTETGRSQARQTELQRQGRIGLTLAALIIGGWAVMHVVLVFFFPLSEPAAWWAVPLLVALQCWLYVGMFIVAHDCMHGSLVPFKPQVNRWVGRIALLLYAGFWYDDLNRKHHLHHRYSGTADDPDYDERPPHGFWRWYLRFFMEYFTGREIVVIAAQVGLYILVFGASYANVLVFLTLPAILSSLQLFTFGTYLPHKPGAIPFTDRHRARSNDLPEWLSLLTCFHFGYHHEHHDKPDVPWWRLPSAHREAGTA